jgi:FAD-linked sulfhydryl oxidase
MSASETREGASARERRLGAWTRPGARGRGRLASTTTRGFFGRRGNDNEGGGDGASSSTTTKEDLGRATWTFLHTFAAQYPDEPTRRQERDAKELIMILTRMYPCGECAEHFAEIVRAHPPDCSSGLALQRWMCAVHNQVNASLGKPWFDCAKVDERWSKLDCDEEDSAGCSLAGRRAKMMR